MIKPEKFGHLHLVYHFTIPLKGCVFKANEVPSSHVVRISTLGTNPIFQYLWEKFRYCYTFVVVVESKKVSL